MLKEIDQTTYIFRRLKSLYPDSSTFYEWYYDGSYLDRAYTEYYNDKKEPILITTHDWYG